MLRVGIPLCAAAATQMPRLVILDPDLIADIYGKKARHYKKPEFMTSFLDPLLGKGLVTSEGALWKQQRHVINPAFTGANIDKMLPLMVAATQACEKMQSTFCVGSSTIDIFGWFPKQICQHAVLIPSSHLFFMPICLLHTAHAVTRARRAQTFLDGWQATCEAAPADAKGNHTVQARARFQMRIMIATKE